MSQRILKFTKRFQSGLDCKKYLSELKWSNGYNCWRCGHPGSQARKDYSRTCNKCSGTESPGADTAVPQSQIRVTEGLPICFEMSTTTKSLSALQVARKYEILLPYPDTAFTITLDLCAK